MRLATWNVNSLRVRLPHVTQWWHTHQPDVLALQETKMENTVFQSLNLGFVPHTAHHGQKAYNGVALLSQHPLHQISTGMGGEDFLNQPRLLTAHINGLTVVSAYVINGESLTSAKFAAKQQFYQLLTQHVSNLLATGNPLVLMGDFNIAADERDVDNPATRAADVLFTPEERQWLQTLLATGLQDSLRLTTPESGIFSWWDYRAGAVQRNRGLRIDYIFVSHNLAHRVHAVEHHEDERLRPQPSDHIPVLLQLK